MTTLKLLCAGASKGVLDRMAATFTAETGLQLDTFFSAVGAIKDKFLAEPCDVLVLTKVLIDELTAQGKLVAGTAGAIGTVHTGVAVRNDEPAPPIATGEEFARSFKAATGGIYVPDTEKSTAGIHTLGVLRKLGIADGVAGQMKTYPNGETAMRHLSQSTEPHAIGCTQVTEINNTAGIKLIGHLPPGYDLSTVYSVAVSAGAKNVEGAKLMVEWLTGARSRALRSQCGFEV
jgi:molybdate transport system substrate-binding protein